MVDGATALRNLDYASNTSLLEDEFFQSHIIPQRATFLCRKLVQTLAPLFIECQIADSSRTDSSAAWSPEHNNLCQIFQAALKLKVEAILSSYQYEMVLHAPGTSIDKAAMVVETSDGCEDPSHLSPVSEVLLCVMPALFSFDQQDPDATVDYNSFIRCSEAERSHGSMLFQATVVLKQ